MKLINDDFPVFGFPTTDIKKPSLIGLDIFEFFKLFFNLFKMFLFCSKISC